MADESCGGCDYYKPLTPDRGLCRVNPPVPYAGTGVTALWPTVQPSDWCGDWEAARTPTVPPVAAPELTTLDPSWARLGDPSFDVRILGTGFTETSVVVWNGADTWANFVSSSELVVFVDMTSEQVGDIPVQVREADALSNTLMFSVLPARR